MKTKVDLICEMIVLYGIILIVCIFIYLIFQSLVSLNLFDKPSDWSSVLTGLLSWSATIYTPIVAYLLFTDWREQEHKKLIRDQAIESIKTLQRYITINLHLSHKEEITVNEFEELQSVYYAAYLSMNMLHKLTKSEDFLVYQEKIQGSFKTVLSYRELIMSGEVDFLVGKEIIRSAVNSTSTIYNKISDYMDINKI